jgi:hypothetical protein
MVRTSALSRRVLTEKDTSKVAVIRIVIVVIVTNIGFCRYYHANIVGHKFGVAKEFELLL